MQEIPVGPVHAGVIEPGHFRFQVVGERILRLEERLGYTHKGIAKHFQHLSLNKGARLAGRISGDNTVAYAWAYSMAVENLHDFTIFSQAEWLRALLLEQEYFSIDLAKNLVYNIVMIKVNIHQAKTHLSKLLAKLKKGETIVICNRNVPIAEIRPLPQPISKSRPIGLAKDQFDIPASFFEDLPEDFLNYFSSKEK